MAKSSPGHLNPEEKQVGEEPGQDIVFYYSRSRRLERASPAVRALNEEGSSRRPSFIGSLTATKPLALLFFTIIIFMAVGFIITLASGKEGQVQLENNTITLEALRFEGTTILVLKKTYKNDAGVYTGAVDLAVSPVTGGAEKKTEDYPVWSHRIFFSLKPQEEYRIAVPFDVPELLVLLQTETKQAVLKVKAR